MVLIRSIFIIVWVLFYASLGCAQGSYADSLYAVWSDTTKNVEERLDAFYQRFDPILDETGNPETARWGRSIFEARKLAEEIGNEKYLARFLFLEAATYHIHTGELEKSCVTARKAFKEGIESGDIQSANASLYLLRPCRDYNPVQFLMTTLQLDSMVAIQIPFYVVLARELYSDSQFPAALRLSQKLLNSLGDELNNDLINYSELIQNLGSIHLRIKNYEESEQYLLSGLESAQKAGAIANVQIGGAYTSLVELYISKQDLSLAEAYRDTAYAFMIDKYECTPCMMKLRTLDAGVDALNGNYREALANLISIKDYYENNPLLMDYNVGNYYSQLSSIYLSLKNYYASIKEAKRGIELTNHNLYSSLQSYKNIHDAYYALGNYKLAGQYYQTYIEARDKIAEVRNSQLVTKQELEFQFEQKRLEDSLQLVQKNLQQELVFQKEISRQKNSRNILIALGIMAAIIAIGMYFRYRFVEKTKTQLEEKNKVIEAEKKKAEASEKAKHQFLANMSHEIRTPMNAIKGMTDILLRREPGKEQIDYLNAIKESSNSLLAIINDILDISKIESGKVNLEIIPFSIDDVVQNVKMITQFKAEEKGLEVKLDIDADLPDTVKGDPTRLHQIILNLVGNAIKFTEKGMVTIQVRSGAKDDVGMVEPVFCISDTGVGIGEDRLDKIFESFEQAYSDTTRKFGGTGLGLSISKKLVEIQGGKIWVKSKKGQGSQFYFTIPFGVSDRKPETEEKGGDKTQDNSILKGVKILLVEDNQFNAIVAREELEDAIEDVVVEVAENGVIAVEKVTYGDFDIILMDIQMPVMNGYEATQVIRNLSNGKSEVPIVAMTANVMQEEVEKCYAAGMNDFIGKPFDSDDLISKIQNLLLQ